MSRYLLFASQAYAFAVLAPLAEAAARRGDSVAWYLHNLDPAPLPAGAKQLHSVDAVMVFKPDAVFAPGNWVPPFFPGLKVEVFHGFSVHKRSLAKGHFRIRGDFDLYCTQGPDTTRGFEALAERLGYFAVRETGWPKVDPLFHDFPPPLPRTDDRPVIMFASTFTPALSCAPHLIDQVSRLAATGRWRWCVTLHPKTDPEIVAAWRALEGPNLSYHGTDEVVRLLKSADVLVSDTSSVVPEFLLQQRPAVTFRNRKPGPELLDIQQPEELEGAIERALTPDPDWLAAIRRYTEHIHPYCDGRSSERVLDATREILDSGARQGLKRKPLNLLRRWKARRRLGYYRLS